MGDSPSSPSTVVSIPNGTEFADGDEPPSSAPRPPSRHPAWADVPETRLERLALAVAARHPAPQAAPRAAPLHRRGTPRHRDAPGAVQARHPALLLLADRPLRPPRPDPAPVGPLAARAGRCRRGRRRGRPARRGQGLARPRPDAPLPRPRLARHDPRLHHVLPVLHAQARDDEARRLGLRLARRPADGRVRPRPPRDPRRDHLGRRPADPPARRSSRSSSRT